MVREVTAAGDETIRRLVIQCLSYAGGGIAAAAAGTQIAMPAFLRRLLTTESIEFLVAVLLVLLFLMPRFFGSVHNFVSRLRCAVRIRTIYRTCALFCSLCLGYFLTMWLLFRLGANEIPMSSEVFHFLLASFTMVAMVFLLAFFFVSSPPVSSLAVPVTQRFASVSDEPLTADAEDELGRIPFVDSLADSIRSLPFPEPFVFGLFARWGGGKTSILNLIGNRLRPESAILLVSFNPWYFSGADTIIRGFFATLSETIRREYAIPDFRQLLSRYSSALTAGARRFGFDYDFASRRPPEELRDDLEKRLRTIDRRVVVLIDDIDRLKPEETRTVLRIVGLCARIKNLCFVLAMDDQLVTRAIATEGIDSAYLEKIVQKPVYVPPPNQDRIDRYFLFSDPPGPEAHRSAVDRLLDSLEQNAPNPHDFQCQRKDFDANIVSFYHKTLRIQFQTIRQVKRLLNALAADLPPVVNDVNLYDFFLLEVLKVFYPDVVQDIWTDRHVYLSGWGADPILLLDPFIGSEGTKKRAKIIDTKLRDFDKHGPVVEAVLEALFPEVQHRDAAERGIEWCDDSRPIEYRRERKLCHRDCFPSYFSLSAGDSDLADSTVHTLIGSWTDAAPTVEDDISQAFCRYRSREKLSELLRKLLLFGDRISQALTPTMLAALRRSTHVYRWGDFSEGHRAVALYLNLLDAQGDDRGQIQTLIERAIRETRPPNFAVHLVLACRRSRGGTWRHVFDAVKEEELRRIGRERLHEYYVAGERDIIDELPEGEWGFVLYQWATDWMTKEAPTPGDVNTYVLSLIEGTPQYLGTLLTHFVQEVCLSTRSGPLCSSNLAHPKLLINKDEL